MTSSDISVELLILRNLITDEKYMRKVIPHLKSEYFEGGCKTIFTEICKFVAKYNNLPNEDSFRVELQEIENISEDQYSTIQASLPVIFDKQEADEEWLLEKTEKWCQDRALFNAVMASITIIDGKHKTLTKDSLPSILTEALSVSFDTSIGHDYLEDFEKRWDFYHQETEHLEFDLEYFNRITKGGLVNKSLNVVLAGTGVGKSLFMCHMAAAALASGYNVLYISCEMSEEKVAERIDANLLDVPIQQIETLSKSRFSERVSDIKKKTAGRLIIHEYPTAAAHTGHFRALINELKLKKKFKPQIIFIDYLNICASSRMKAMGGSINSYTYIKAIAEEIRGLAIEFNVPIVTATQTTREGYGNSDIGLEDTSESFGLPATADLMFALISSEELEANGQIMVKQLKNRYNDISVHRRFVIGLDRSRMRLFDIDESEQGGVMKDGPVFDNTNIGQQPNPDKNFQGFKI